MKYGNSLELPGQEQQGKTYLVETQDGFQVRVPEDKLESWQKAQKERGNAPLNRAEQQLADKIVQSLYRRKK